MKLLMLATVLLLQMTALCFTGTYVSWDMPELEDYRSALEKLTGRSVGGTYLLLIASSAGEFSELSGIGYWFLAAAEGETIIVQPLSLIPNLSLTLAHEMAHLSLRKYQLPYWLEEGMVCSVTGEWIGREEMRLDEVESLDYANMDFMTYRSYSFTCWIEVSRLLRELSFGELILEYGEGGIDEFE
ncbi:MAG TPA: hypothetical protein ENN47_10320 [Mesotoga infera]|uniref:Peptidase MA-like domain-containing protein n=1 Tax=Mesotoga infera TaxID=1236046 RepID=A0A7C1CWH1_9BACT|nr:hypothetical protein [Mesotoga infera]